jgi:hypothetical protein
MTRTLLCALAVLLLSPAVASAESESVTSGATTATLSWSGEASDVSGARLTITRAGAVAFDRPIREVVCDGCALPGNGADDVKLVDLDGLGEPEAIVTGGQVAGFYSFSATAGVYDELRFNTPVGFNLDDLDRDGQTEIVTEDTRFEAPVNPPQVFIFTRQDDVPLLADVTSKFTALIKRSAAQAKRARLWDVYVADQFLLGRGSAGLRELDKQIKRGKLGSPARAKRYRRQLLSELKRFGYR